MIEVQVPSELFPGFYNTFLDPCDYEDLCEDDWESYKQDVCERCVNIISDYFPIKEWRLWSPREYNYRNDELYVTIDWSWEEFIEEFIVSDYTHDSLEWDFSIYNTDNKRFGLVEAFMYFVVGEGQDIDYEEKLKFG